MYRVDGHCEEWTQSGCCPIHRCAREHNVQMFCGEPKPHTISFMQVIGIERMHDYITSTGWDKITEVVTQHWGGKTCSLTTIDGYIINIFE